MASETKTAFRATSGSHLTNKDAQKYGARLAVLESRHGFLTPAIIVRDARRERSPLHDFFTWDVDDAFEEYLQQRARYLLRSIKVVYEESGDAELVVRNYIPVVVKGKNRFASVTVVASDAALRDQALRRAKRELAACAKKCRLYSELGAIGKSIERFLRKLDGKARPRKRSVRKVRRSAAAS